MAQETIELANRFFSRPETRGGAKPLKTGTEVELRIREDSPICLVKEKTGFVAAPRPAANPDITLTMQRTGFDALVSIDKQDIGELGVEILKLMAHSDPEKKIRVQVHIGVLKMATRGYFGIIPLGGKSVMSFLATKGFGNLSKIKAALEKLRS